MPAKSAFSAVDLAHKTCLAAEEQGYTLELMNALAEHPTLFRDMLQGSARLCRGENSGISYQLRLRPLRARRLAGGRTYQRWPVQVELYRSGTFSLRTPARWQNQWWSRPSQRAGRQVSSERECPRLPAGAQAPHPRGMEG